MVLVPNLHSFVSLESLKDSTDGGRSDLEFRELKQQLAARDSEIQGNVPPQHPHPPPLTHTPLLIAFNGCENLYHKYVSVLYFSSVLALDDLSY